MKIDFDHFRGDRIAEEILSNLAEEGRLTIIQKLQPKLIQDGNQWCYILGEMPQNYLAGWGDTPARAMDDFVVNFYNQKLGAK